MASTLPEEALLLQFNQRDTRALEKVYNLFYNELHYYAYKLYKDTNENFYDAVHDVFINLWCSKTQFEKLINIKAYLFVALRNHFKHFMLHNKHITAYQKNILMENADSEDNISRSEIFAYLQSLFDILPKESADILRLSLEGFEIDEIALKLGKSKQTIYNKKSEAIKKLREYVKKEDELKLILCLLRTPKSLLPLA